MRAERALVVMVLALGPALALAGAGCSSPSQAGPAVAVDPGALYAQMCARCHGMDGRGDPEMKKTIPGIRDFSEPAFQAMAPEQVEQVIMVGRNQMPGFGPSLTRPKIQHLGGYVRRLGWGDRAPGGAR
jgi:mono/diheme cytochrome c family protein